MKEIKCRLNIKFKYKLRAYSTVLTEYNYLITSHYKVLHAVKYKI